MKRLKSLVSRYNNADVRFHVTVILVSLSSLLTVFRYPVSIQRLKAAVIDFGLSIAHWFVYLTEDLWMKFRGSVPVIPVRRRELPDVDISRFLPFSLDDLYSKLTTFIPNLFNLKLFLDYNLWLLELLYNFAMYGSLLIPAAIALWFVYRDSLTSDHGKPMGSFSEPLIALFGFVRRRVKPCIEAVRSYALYMYDNASTYVILALIWALNLNVVTIFVEVLGFYFYFVSSFDVLSLVFQLAKLLIDAVIMFDGLPLLFWIPICGAIYWMYISAKGLDKLRHFDAMNCGALKELAYVSLLIGPPGVGKTTLLTSFSLYFVNIFKKDSFDTLYDIEMTFPAFPFVCLRRALDERIDSGMLRNIPECWGYIDKQEALFLLEPSPEALFGYDPDLFGDTKNVGTKIESLYSALRTYAAAYFVYRCENYSVSNYPIRFDGQFDDSPYLKKWDGDFYNKDLRSRKKKSRYSHILDQDIMRPGKKKDPNNPNIGAFGFGIYSNTEWGKARGNQLTTVDEDKASEICNRKNDLYSYSLKMSRHANTTIANKVYFRFIGDEQRPQSLAADQRDLCDVISIVNKSELRLTLPHAAWLDKIYDKVYVPFKEFYVEYAGARGDMCLPVFAMKMGVSAISAIYKRIYNRYGYYTLTLAMQNGTAFSDASDGKAEPKLFEYNMPVMQVYSERYNTDCYSGFFTKQQLDTHIGINDLKCYDSLTMTPENMVAQHDFFLDELMGIMENGTGVKPEKNGAKSASSKRTDSQKPNYIFQSF